MTVDELLELFPGANPSDLKGKVEQAKSYPSFGRSEYSFPGTQHKDRLESLSFHVGLFDGRVSHFQIYYKFNNRTEPELIYNREQLIEKLSASFMLPSDAKWQEVGYAELRLVCQGFTLQVNYQSSI